MKRLFFISFFLLVQSLQAQVYKEGLGFEPQSIAQLDIGWIKLISYTQPAKPLQLNGRSYSATQIRYCEEFIEWMQQTYTPKGCLGDVRYFVNDKPGTAYLDQLKNALPQLYGSYAKMYTYLKKDANGKYAPENNFANMWRIEANQLENISQPVRFISTPTDYFFIMPYYSSSVQRDWSNWDESAKWLGFDSEPNLKNYLHFFQPKDATRYGIHQYVVLMTADGNLPFEPLTIGEFLSRAETQLPIWRKNENRSAELLATAKANLARLKNKYKTRLTETAAISSNDDITFYTFVNAIEGKRDMFDTEGRTTFPIYRVNEQAAAACKTDQPQWIVVRWDQGSTQASASMHLHNSILNQFNFDYLHAYVFRPTNVSGQSYKPLK